jgi:dTMP kinase
MFLSFDGIDGVGKSTQMRLLCEWLAERRLDVVTCRDPGSTPLGERIREILLHSDEKTPIARRSEMLLYMAARAQLVDEVIRPALAAGRVVVSDRYLLANLVYQAYAGGLDLEAVRQVGQVAIDGIEPDAVFLLDMAPNAADERMDRARDRMENQGADYRQRLREGFLAEARRPGRRIHVIDAGRSINVVQADIRAVVESLLHRNARQHIAPSGAIPLSCQITRPLAVHDHELSRRVIDSIFLTL